MPLADSIATIAMAVNLKNLLSLQLLMIFYQVCLWCIQIFNKICPRAYIQFRKLSIYDFISTKQNEKIWKGRENLEKIASIL